MIACQGFLKGTLRLWLLVCPMYTTERGTNRETPLSAHGHCRHYALEPHSLICRRTRLINEACHYGSVDPWQYSTGLRQRIDICCQTPYLNLAICIPPDFRYTQGRIDRQL